jgi:transcriptional regulator with XRE-family HTH domain
MAIHKLENYLKTYRKRAGISQREMDFLLGAHSGSKTSRYEHFKRTPNLETAFACEALFHAPARELFAGIYSRAERRTILRARVLRKRLLAKKLSPRGKLILLNTVVGDDANLPA